MRSDHEVVRRPARKYEVTGSRNDASQLLLRGLRP
jgi:hypothetical protein